MSDAAIRPGESSYQWLCRYAGNQGVHARCLIDRMFQRLPQAAKADIRSRFGNKRQDQHLSALFEIQLHSLFEALEWAPEFQDAPANSRSKPDFVASPEGLGRVAIEATMLHPDPATERADQWLYSIFQEAAKHCREPGYGATVTGFYFDGTQPSGKSLACHLDNAFRSHRAEDVANAGLAGIGDHRYEHGDSWITYRVAGAEPSADEELHTRLFCQESTEWTGVGLNRLREVIRGKRHQHRDINLPKIIAIGAGDPLISASLTPFQVCTALLGSMSVSGSFSSRQTRVSHASDGVWKPHPGGNDEPIAVLVVYSVTPSHPIPRHADLYLHPRLPPNQRPHWPLRYWACDEVDYLEHAATTSAEELFNSDLKLCGADSQSMVSGFSAIFESDD